jgi:hypothetical protein
MELGSRMQEVEFGGSQGGLGSKTDGGGILNHKTFRQNKAQQAPVENYKSNSAILTCPCSHARLSPIFDLSLTRTSPFASSLDVRCRIARERVPTSRKSGTIRLQTLCEEERARRYPNLAIILGN